MNTNPHSMKSITCESCSMSATHTKKIHEVVHYYCDHHAPHDATPLVHIIEKSELQKLTPLLSIFTSIGLLIILTEYLKNDFSSMNSMMLFMAYFFLVFGFFKVINIRSFVKAYMTYDVLAMRSKVYAYAYPFIELGLGIAYFLSFGGIYRDAITFVLMSVGTYGVWKALANKEDIPCACLGMVFNVPMTKVTLFENLLMALMALYMVVIYLMMGNMPM